MSYKIRGCGTTCYPIRTNQGKVVWEIAALERTTYSNIVEVTKNGAVAEACGGFTSLAEHQKHREVA